MKRNLLFNQLTAIGKRLAMVLTMLLIVGVGQAWGETIVATFSSDEVVTNSGYAVYESNDWYLSKGGNNVSGGYNAKNSTTIGNAFGTSAKTSDNGFYIKSKTTLSNVSKITFTYTAGSGYSGAKIYLGYSTNGSNWNAVSLTSGTQGMSAGNLSTTYTMQFAAISSAYYAIIVSNGTTTGAFRLDNITATFYGTSGGGNDETPDDDAGDACGWVEADISEITSTDNVVITMSKGDNVWALANNNGTGSAPTALPITIADGEITPAEDDFNYNGYTLDHYTWNISTNSDALTFYPKGSTSTWLYCTGTNNGVRVGTNTNKTFKISGNYLQHTNTLRYVGVYTTNPDWRCYTSTTTSNIYGQTLKFYKYVECATETTYSVTYDANGATSGSVPEDNTEYAQDDQVTVLDNTGNLTKTGHTYNGWNTKADGKGSAYAAGANFTITDNTTLYAQWKANTYSITLNANGGSGNTASVKATYDSSTLNPSSITNPTKTGYTFGGWYSGEGGTGSLVINSSGKLQANVSGFTGTNSVWKATTNKTLYAKWTPAVYTINYKDQGNATFSGTHESGNPTQHTYGTETTLKGATKTGYTFGGWYKESNCSGGTEVTTLGATEYTDNITLYAKWTAKTYTITLDANGGKFVKDGNESETIEIQYVYGTYANYDQAKLISDYLAEEGIKLSREGHQLNEMWQSNGSAWKRVFTTIDRTIIAQWSKLYSITLSENGTTTELTPQTSTTYKLPAELTAGSCQDDTKELVGWSTVAIPNPGDRPTSNFYELGATVTLTKDQTPFYAVFATQTTIPGGTEEKEQTTTLNFSAQGYENQQEVTSLTIDDVTVTFNKGSNNNTPKYYNTGTAVRVYGGGYFTMSGVNLTKIVITTSSGEDSNEIAADCGAYEKNTKTWTGSNQSVKFTIGGTTGHRRINSIAVTYTTTVQADDIISYSEYTTTCVKLPDPVWEGATIDKTSFTVNCGERSPMDGANGAAKITFPTDKIYNFTSAITIEATTGFLVSTSQSVDANYKSSVSLSPLVGTTNANTFYDKHVYVRAEAPAQSDTDLEGTITIKNSDGETLQTFSVTADVTCTQYTLTLNDRGTKTTAEYYAGASVPKPEDPTGVCTDPIHYVFDGWAEATVAAGATTYTEVTFPYTVTGNTKFYAVYRYLEGGGNGDYNLVTSALDDWSGDYLIAYSNQIFANGKIGGKEGIGAAGEKVDLSSYLNNNTIPAAEGDKYKVSLEAINGGYLLKTQDGKYNYQASNTNGLEATTNKNTATTYKLSVNFVSFEEINLCLSGNAQGAIFRYNTEQQGYFRFYKNGGQQPVYLYKKADGTTYYTTSPVCGPHLVITEGKEIYVTGGNAGGTRDLVIAQQKVSYKATRLQTSNGLADGTAPDVKVATNGITVGGVVTQDVKVTIDQTKEQQTDGTYTITGTITIQYQPSANNKQEDIQVQLAVDYNAEARDNFTVHARSLPAEFVIVAKSGDKWYALPANCVNSSDSKQGILIDVNDINNPTSAIAPTTTKYGLRGVKPGRQTTHGQSILFTERVSGKQYALYQNSGTNENIWVYAQYDNYDNENPTYYEWIPSTNDLTNYTFTHSASSRKLGVNENGVFGAYTTDVQVRLLPATFYDQVAVQVIKWKENSVIVMYTGAATTATTQVGTHDATAQTLANQKITHGIYELTTAQSLTANAGKILTMCFGTAQVKVEIPLIVNGTTTASKNGHDVVILDGGQLTASTTLYSYKNVYVYGGGKLAIPTGTQLGVKNIILRAGGVATDGNGQNPTYQHIYPQVELKGTLSTPTNASGFMKYEYVTDYDHWYHLVLPFDAQYNTITYPQEYYGDNVTSNNTGSWQIKRYAGEIRATGNYDAWVDIETENANAVTAGKGYIYWAAPKKVTVNGSKERQKWGIQRITLGKTPSVATTEENKEKKISGLSSYATIQGNSGKDNDQGWNLIGNPYMMNLSNMDETGLQVGKLVEEEVNGKWTGRWEWLNDGFRYLTIPSDHFDTYTAKTISTAAPLVPGRAFFVQLAGNANAVTFKAANRPNLMPALRATTQIEKDIETGIILSNETMQDEMNFWIKDGKTNDYEYNADYPKTPNNNRFNIYGVHAHGDLSWVAISPELAAESMPIGYQVPAAGTYMLSLSETYYSDDLQALYVTDHAVSPEITVDLMTNNYYFDVNQAETNDTRFTVSLQVKSSGNGGVTTDNENIDVDKNQPIKFIYQDKLYILRNGVIYDGTGKQVQTINK